MSSLLLGASLLSTAFAAVQFGGVNIAGFDFGVDTNGDWTSSSVDPPLASSGGSDGQGQMAHFASADNFNIFRLPVAWQYLVNDVLGGTLDSTNFATYDTLVQSCLSTGAHCIIDIHNYARWNGEIIGQGGPTNDQFTSLWSQLAEKYASEDNVIFGIMNEPHDLTVSTWGESVQAAVTAIRTAGATSQICLLPGSDYTSAASYISDGSYAALKTVTNLDGTTTNLIFDVHKYLDSDGSGTSSTCVSNEISAAFEPLATQLRTDSRQALLSETGGGSSDSSCMTDVCAAIDYLNENSDVYLGYVGWAAGSFATSYVLSLTPSGSNSTGWTDQELTSCFARNATSGSTTSSSSSVVASTTSAIVASSSSVVTSVEASTTSSETVSSFTSATSVTSAAPVLSSATSSAMVYSTPTTFATSVVAPSTVSSSVAPVETDDPDTCEE